MGEMSEKDVSYLYRTSVPGRVCHMDFYYCPVYGRLPLHHLAKLGATFSHILSTILEKQKQRENGHHAPLLDAPFSPVRGQWTPHAKVH